MTKHKEPLSKRLERVRGRLSLPTKPGHERTAEGKEVRTPTAGEFFENLEKASKPDKG